MFYHKDQPSSIMIFWPLIYLELLEIKKDIAPTISIGSKSPLFKQLVLYFLTNILLWLSKIPPGLIQLIFKFLFFEYLARYLVIEIIPDLIAEYSIGDWIEVPL